VIRFFYNLLWPFGLLVFLPGYLRKMLRRGGYREKFGQRLGIYDVGLCARLANCRATWLHAVSVGEVGIALKLARELRALQPDLRCVLTTTTTTGFALANQIAPPWIEVMYNPVDFWPVMRRAFAVIRPARIILIEAEVWPNLVAEAHARRIPVILANARLSPRSERRFRRFRFFVAPTFRLLDLVCVVELEDVDRWAALGAARARIQQTGSVKYDAANVAVDPTAPLAVLRALKIDNPEIIGAREEVRSRRPIILGGSTHPGEEEVLAQIFRQLRAEFVDLFLVLAPRHAERASEVQRALTQLGLRVALRSQSDAASDNFDCLLLDTTGELRNWYAIATVVFIGKSLLAHGGQNPAEVILAGKPVIFGPHMENFAVFAQSLVERSAAVQVYSANELHQAIVDLLRDADARGRLVMNARDVLAIHTGATARTARLILDLHVHR
jgi:3-deoxy-D-manno-octulosonic-acid transferase